jgi:hypothetical protein
MVWHQEVRLPEGASQVNRTGTPIDVVAARSPECASGPAVPARPEAATTDHVRAARPARVPTECGDLPFLIKRDGTWLYRGTPINRKELVCLFSSVLRREEDGSWWLQTPAERGRIEVEDAPFTAVELDWTGDGRHQVLSFRTNIDEVVTAGPDHPIRVSHDLITCEPTPYLLVRPGAAPHLGIEARINRATYYELVALAVPEWVGNKRLLGVWSQNQFFSLGEMPPGAA